MVGFALHDADRKAEVAVAEDQAGAAQLQRTVRRIQSSWMRGLDTGEVGLLRISRFDHDRQDYVVPIVLGWDADDLARGVGLYTDGAGPGQAGNVVLAGHRITHGSPFADFPALQVGDRIKIETARRMVSYRLLDSGTDHVVSDTAVWPTWSTPDPDVGSDQPTTQHFLTLITCAETFHTDQRSVVVAIQKSSKVVRRTPQHVRTDTPAG